MKSMIFKYFSILTAALVISALSYAEARSGASGSAKLPASLLGIWQVSEVHIDTGATRTPMYNNNDVRLTSRLFTLEPDKLTTDTPEEKICTNPKVSTTDTTATDLIGHSMAGRGFPPEIPTPKDYDLSLADDTPIEALSINCKEGFFAGGLGREGGLSGAWLVALADDKLAVRWYDETILILKKLPLDAKPLASFDCGKAASSVEKTICGSIGLAAFDKSIGEAYSSAFSQYKEQAEFNFVSELRSQQKKWLETRNHCGSDVDCLQKAMEERLQALVSGPTSE